MTLRAWQNRKKARRAAVIGATVIAVLLIAMGLSVSQASEQSEVLWSNNNPNSVHNNAEDYYVMLDIEKECVVTSIMTYHYFNEGALPGTITLYAESGEQWGPFNTVGLEGQGGIQNAYWVADVGEIRLAPGRYAIEDSDPSTWSNNALSDNKGIAELRGYVVTGNPFGAKDSGTDAGNDNGTKEEVAVVTEPNNNDATINPGTEGGLEFNEQSLLEKAQVGDPEAQKELGDKYYYGTDVQQDYAQAVVWYRKAAEQGNVFAQYALGYMYEYAEGVAQDQEQAAAWYRKAAEQEYAIAQPYLAHMYYFDESVVQGFQKNEELTRKAADQGEAWAQCNLGHMYFNGYGVTQDFEQAIAWYRKAADQGYVFAQYALGYIYNGVLGVEIDKEQAFAWFQKAAQQGYVTAQFYMGVMYRFGYGVAQDFEQAIAWYRRAADQGYVLGQGNLGLMYYNGEGVAQDYEQAFVWYQKAAEQGNAFFQTLLAGMYENGEGVEMDIDQAIAWYQKAADQGYEDAAEALKRLQ